MTKSIFENFNGIVEVEVGKPWKIRVTIDDNLEKLLTFSEDKTAHALTLSFKGIDKNRMYIENTKIKISITMPEISVVSNNGNSDVTVRNVVGSYLNFENFGNGNCAISGTIDLLDINRSGNGDINASRLSAKQVKVSSNGNGDVSVNASNEFSAQSSGNVDVTNIDKAKFDSKSSKKGNGELILK